MISNADHNKQKYVQKVVKEDVFRKLLKTLNDLENQNSSKTLILANIDCYDGKN